MSPVTNFVGIPAARPSAVYRSAKSRQTPRFAWRMSTDDLNIPMSPFDCILPLTQARRRETATRAFSSSPMICFAVSAISTFADCT